MRLLLLFLWFFFLFDGSCVDAIHRNVALVGPWQADDPYEGGWANVADRSCTEANELILAPDDDSMSCNRTDTLHEDPATAVLATVDICIRGQTDLILGTVTSGTTRPVIIVAGTFGVPVWSWSASSDGFSDKKLYPLFSRNLPVDSLQGAALAQLVESMGVRRIGIISSKDDYGESLSAGLQRGFKNPGVVAATRSVSMATVDIVGALEYMKSSDVKWIALICNVELARVVMREADKKGMLAAGYEWLGTDGSITSAAFPVGSIGTNYYVNVSSTILQKLYTTANVSASVMQDGIFASVAAPLRDLIFLAALAQRAANNIVRACVAPVDQPRFCSLWNELCSTRNDSNTCSNLHTGCTNMTNTDPICQMDQRVVISDAGRLIRFEGAFGLTKLDKNGDSGGVFAYVNQVANATLSAIGVIETTSDAIVLSQDPVWPGNLDSPPSDGAGVRLRERVDVVINWQILILTMGVAIVGSWVPLILVEQATQAHKHNDDSLARRWMFLATMAQSLCAWCTACIMLTAVTLPSLPVAESSSIGIRTSWIFPSVLIPVAALLVAFPSLLPTLVSRKIKETSSSTSGSISLVISVDHESKLESKKHFVPDTEETGHEENKLRNKQRKFILLGCVSLGVTASLVIQAVMAVKAFDLPCSAEIDGGMLALGVFLGVAMTTVGLWWLFVKRRTVLRFVGALIMGAAVIVPHACVILSMKLTYTGTVILSSDSMSMTTLRIIGLVLCVAFAILCIVINATVLRQSADSLDLWVMNLQQEKHGLEGQIAQLKQTVADHEMDARFLRMCTPPFAPVQARHRLMVQFRTSQQNEQNEQNYQQNQPQNQHQNRQPSVTYKRLPEDEGKGNGKDNGKHSSKENHNHNHQLTVSNILESSTVCAVFKHYCFRKHSSENIAFLEEVYAYDKSKDSTERLAIIQNVRDIFFDIDHPDYVELNIGALKKVQLARIDEALRTRKTPDHIFEPSRAEVASLVERGDLPEFFKDAPMVKLCIEYIHRERCQAANRTARTKLKQTQKSTLVV